MSSMVTHLLQVETVPVAVGAGAMVPVADLVGITVEGAVEDALVDVTLATTVLLALVDEAAAEEEALLVSRPRAEEVEDP